MVASRICLNSEKIFPTLHIPPELPQKIFDWNWYNGSQPKIHGLRQFKDNMSHQKFACWEQKLKTY